jgi:AcrR family transcriptional regulator
VPCRGVSGPRVRARRSFDAAAEVFDRNGYPGAGLAEILDTAGVTKGALYFHFASKEELARAIIADQVVDDVGTDIEGPALQYLIDLSFQVARQLVRNVRARAAVRLAIEHASFAVPLADPYLDWIRITRSLLIRAGDNGELRPGVDADQVAHLVVAAFTGVQLTSEVSPGARTWRSG